MFQSSGSSSPLVIFLPFFLLYCLFKLRSGVVDAVVGMIKSYARRKVLSRRANILNAANLQEVCADLKICFLSYTKFNEQWMSETGKVR
jgi:hypothetical protein